MTDWVEVTALIVGPVLAVGLTIWTEKRRRERDVKLSVMRQLLLSSPTPGDPAFTSAINLIPIVFGRDDAVMTAWETFNAAAGKNAATGEQVSALARAMLISAGFNERAAHQVTRSTYLSSGLIERQLLLDQALRSLPPMAASIEASARANAALVAHVTGGGDRPAGGA